MCSRGPSASSSNSYTFGIGWKETMRWMSPDRFPFRQAAAAILVVVAVAAAGLHAQGGAGARPKALDEILDMNVRDGMVYYRALKFERARLDGYVASLANVAIDSAPAN